MTSAEFEYIQRAIKTLEGPVSLMERIKIERTMGQILTRSADKLEETFVADVDHRMAVNHLVDILSK